MKCTKCGNEFEGNFCSACGTPVNVTQNVQTKPVQQPRHPRKKGLIVGIVFSSIATILMIIGLLPATNGTASSDDISTPTSSNTSEESANKPVQYLEVTANDLYNTFRENEIKAQEIYIGQEIKLTGTVNEINAAGVLTSANVLLNVDGTFIGCVQCNFSSENAKALANINKGQKITVIGTCGNLEVYNVMVTNCQLVQ